MIPTSHKIRPKKELVIVLEDLDFGWTKLQLETITDAWNQGWSIDRIAKAVKRQVDEVALAIMHLARQDRIINRPGGVLGG